MKKKTEQTKPNLATLSNQDLERVTGGLSWEGVKATGRGLYDFFTAPGPLS